MPGNYLKRCKDFVASQATWTASCCTSEYPTVAATWSHAGKNAVRALSRALRADTSRMAGSMRSCTNGRLDHGVMLLSKALS
jgi:hypothetical protein